VGAEVVAATTGFANSCETKSMDAAGLVDAEGDGCGTGAEMRARVAM
jgi:hypothetical protein